ncbi:N-methyl-L-tryptophan oxidase [Lentibacillus amyloliquefaciens]|uniref:Methyltryptophan oxidase n=1 Tax=Lentibacillus amyloliquefaciens TaxID=1472767 RepID=A0A0U4GBJ9_9BACI|nr:N-methyl-L-tryptophan oxidase [Lentibacillus amyloliquefaciens]ALX50106.1 methyltryptophan oxidase [Lentibacillus amyloliquefaciens]
MKSHYDVIIVGAGSMGMAAGYYLAKEGTNTLLIDAFDPPHSNGSHSGDTRLIRHACGEGYEYVPLALRAQELWDELQQKTSETIFRKTGVVTFGPEDSDFVNQAIAGGKKYSLPIDTFDNGEEINERWTGITAPEAHFGCYEPEAGVLFSGNCIRTFRKLALQSGADLLTHTPVDNLDVTEHDVTVHTKEGSYTADKLIVSAGAWNKKLLSDLNLNLALQPSRQTIGWFDADESIYQADGFPGFFVDLPTGIYYGFPSIDGAGLKIGRYDNGEKIEPEYMNREFGILPKDEDDVREFLKTFMPQAAGKLNVGKTCMFTNTPDENFIIDLHPEHSHVAIAGGFSGHGYKFSSVVGEILSQLATSGTTNHDISLFSATRPSLQTQGSTTV